MLYGQAPLPASAGSFRSRILSVASGTEKQNLPAIFASRKFFESGRIATLLRTKLCERHERDPQADKVLVYSIKDGRPVPNAQVQHELSVIPVIIQNLPVFVSLQQGSNRFPNMYKPAETVSKSRKKHDSMQVPSPRAFSPDFPDTQMGAEQVYRAQNYNIILPVNTQNTCLSTKPAPERDFTIRIAPPTRTVRNLQLRLRHSVPT